MEKGSFDEVNELKIPENFFEVAFSEELESGGEDLEEPEKNLENDFSNSMERQNSFALPGELFNTSLPQEYLIQSLAEDNEQPSSSPAPVRNIETSSEALLMAEVVERDLDEVKSEYASAMKRLKTIENNFRSMKTFLENDLKRKSCGPTIIENPLFNENTDKAFDQAASIEPDGLSARELKQFFEEVNSTTKKREVVLKFASGKIPKLFSQLMHVERHLKKRKLEKVDMSKLRLLNKMKTIITVVDDLMFLND